MKEIKSLIDDDIKENIDHSAICVKFAMMSKQIENKDKEIEKLNSIINNAIDFINGGKGWKKYRYTHQEKKLLEILDKGSDSNE